MNVTASGGTYATDEEIEGWADGNHDPTHGARLELSRSASAARAMRPRARA